MREGALKVALALVAGCGGPGAFDGRVGGQTLSVRAALFHGGPADTTPTVLTVSLQSVTHDEACRLLSQRMEKVPSALLVFHGGQAAVKPGELGVISEADLRAGKNPGGKVSGFFFGVGGARTELSGGTVKLESFELGQKGSAKGSFDVTFGADPVKGWFYATGCP